MGSSLVGSKLGRFRVDRLLGRGGMGEVYAAFDERLEREVALKVLSEEGNLLTQKKRLMREAKLAAKLNHPNIATIYEVDELGDRLYIVMELLEGSPLRRILAQRKMEVDEAISVGRDVARALARAHAGGVIHRDIKPENVFVTQPSPDALLTKVLDFGLARQRPDGVTVAEQTYTATRGDMWGTPGYVSPEQAHGQTVDVRSDVFSFGVIFYEMLAGIKPFRADTPLGIMIATTRTEARPLREIRPEIPPAVEEVVRRCMRKDREGRYADGAALSAALETFIRGNPSPYAMSSVIGANPGGPILSLEDVGGNVIATGALEGDTRTTGNSAAIVMPLRGEDALPLEQQRREHMKLVAAIGSGVATALVLVVAILAWVSSPRSPRTKAASTVNAEASVSVSVSVARPGLEAPEPPPVAVVSAAPSPGPAADPEPAPEAAESAAPAPPLATAAASAAATEAPPATHPAAAARGGAPGVAPSSHGPRKKPADCADPFKVDAKGVKIPKLYCL